MTKKLRERQAMLERQGLFAVDMNEQHRTFDALDIDGDYDYLPKKPLERIRRAWLLSVIAAVGPLVTWIAQGMRVKGRKNLRAVRGGAISVCNHVHMLDTLFVKNAVGAFRVYHTGSYYLLKRGVLGRLFKAGGFLPVGTKFKDIKKLQETVIELVNAGKIINFYPEHALWPQYERLRPFQSGAFHCAVKANAPVLPLFIEFRSTPLRRFLHMKKKAIVHILPAVYPPPAEAGTLHERAQALSGAVFEEMRAEGNRLYGCEVRAADYVAAGAAEGVRTAERCGDCGRADEQSLAQPAASAQPAAPVQSAPLAQPAVSASQAYAAESALSENI